MSKLIIAEKPSVAKSIASALGASSRADGFYEGNGLLVSWCVGHLVSPMDAGSYDECFKKWRYDDLPILPEPFRYPSDRFTFSSHGYDLHIENELVADAFAGLPVQEQSILILHFVLDLPDQEVGRLVGMSRSAVQRRRTKSLSELRIKLMALMPKGG